LMKLFKEGKISFEDVMIYSHDPEQVKLQLAAEGFIDEKLASKKYGESIVIEEEEAKG